MQKENHIGENICTALAARGWSQSDLAREIGSSPSHVNRWCSGVYAPSTKYLRKIAEALGFEIDQLRNGILSVSKSQTSFEVVSGDESDYRDTLRRIVREELAADPRLRLMDERIERIVKLLEVEQ